ncbi:MAG TPA: hypothetical protein VGJ45_24590 [Pseudonocardiaceae bacterium]|jgi:hypothetical protein
MTARPEEEQPERGSRAAVTGSASDMVQAGAVHGGVHFHGAGEFDDPRAVRIRAEVADRLVES